MFQNGLLLSGGDILTFEPEFPRGHGLIVVDGRVVFVGDRLDLEPVREATKMEPTFRVVDLRGACVLPGLVGSRHSLEEDARSLDRPNLRNVCGLEALMECAGGRAQNADPGTWLLGRDLPGALASLEGLREALDRVAPRNPVCFLGGDDSWGVVNTLALKVARGNSLDEESTSGAIRGPLGTPTGVVRGTLLQRIRSMLPGPSETRRNKLAENVLQEWASRGWTAASDLGGCRVHSLLAARRERTELPVRVRTSILRSELDAALVTGIRTSTGDAILRRGELIFAGEDWSCPPDELARDFARALRAGIASAFLATTPEHASAALDLVTPHKGEARGFRHRLVGLREVSANDLRRSETLPVRLFFDLGDDGELHEPVREWLDGGGQAGFAVAGRHPEPWRAFRSAGLGAGGSALELYANHLRAERLGAWGPVHGFGTLREGAAADFVVLDRNPFEESDPPRVLATCVGGRFTFELPGWTKR